jgi:hypothetical protein
MNRRASRSLTVSRGWPRVARQGEGWWACLDSNQKPDRCKGRTLPGGSSKISVSRSRSFTFVRVCSRGFCRIIGGMGNRRVSIRSGPRWHHSRG